MDKKDQEKKWEIFISCKIKNSNGDGYTRDHEIATSLYEFLKENSINVFFSEFSLEKLGAYNFPEVIDHALDVSKILVVVGTSTENIESRWVKFEWRSFLNDIVSGVNPNKKVFAYIENMNEKELPYALRQVQTFKHSEKSMNLLLKYISNSLNSKTTDSEKILQKDEKSDFVQSKSNELKIEKNSGQEKEKINFFPIEIEKVKIEEINKQDKYAQMVYVDGGSFEMGNSRNDPEGFGNEKPVHKVCLGYNYYIGKYPVTFNEYDKDCEETGTKKPTDEGWGRGKRPVINVSWYDAIRYCNWFSEKEGLPVAYDCSNGNLLDEKGMETTNITRVKGYRLPTEAEWEYAARGGKKSRGCKYSGSNNPDCVAWYKSNFSFGAHIVGEKQPNELGLYDMSGNVWEWCNDWYNNYSYTEEKNPISLITASDRIKRGGCWNDSTTYIRIAARSGSNPTFADSGFGFRICKTVDN